MSDADILVAVKTDLQISVSSYDTHLTRLIGMAKELIEKEGASLDASSIPDGILVAQYTAYLWRKRAEDVPMPRSLRWALNNKLFSQKGTVSNG